MTASKRQKAGGDTGSPHGISFFHTFSMRFLQVCMIVAAVCTFVQLGFFQKRPGIVQIVWMACTAGIILAGSRVRKRLDERPADRRIRLSKTVEGLVAGLLLLAGTVLRLLVIYGLPVIPTSDFGTYYGVADTLSRDAMMAEGAWYREYIAFFPHVLGYPAVLSILFRMFGTSVHTALIFNLALQTASCFLTWRIARRMAGQVRGLIALAFICFLPSTILYSGIVASEPLFTFLMMVAVWLFMRLIRPGGKTEKFRWMLPAGYALLGLLVAAASFIRPFGVIFVIAAVICLFTVREEEKADSEKKRILHRPAVRKSLLSLILAGFYLLGSTIFSSYTARVIRKEPAGASVSFGYNLMVGMNLRNAGNWNEEDALFRDEALAMTDTAADAQRVCLDKALERMKSEVLLLPALMCVKFALIWGTDSYGEYWIHLFMKQQGELTPERETFLSILYDLSDMYYLLILICAAFFAYSRLRRKPDAGYVTVLLICGTVAAHLLVETQIRYHYFALYMIAILGAIGFPMLIRWSEAYIEKRKNKKAVPEGTGEEPASEENSRA